MPFSNFSVLKSCSSESIASPAVGQTRSATSPGRAALFRFAWRSVFAVRAHDRKRCSTRLLQSTHTARPSRRLLSPAEPGSRRAGHAVCLRLWWLGRFRIRIAQRQQPIRAVQQLPVPSVSTSRQLWSFFHLMRSPTATISDSEARRFTSQPSHFGIVAESLSYNPMTPNHALQRTPGFGVQLPSAAVVRPAQSRAVLPAMKPGTARAFASRRRAPTRAPGPESLSLGSLGVFTRHL